MKLRRFLSIVLVFQASILSAQFPVKSYFELKFDKIERQKNEIFCGPAVLSSILKNYYNLSADQNSIFLYSIEAINNEKRNFSFWDMCTFLDHLDFSCMAFKVNEPALDSILVRTKVPIIVHTFYKGINDTNESKNGHFLLILGIVGGDFYLINDPTFGKQVVNKQNLFSDLSGNVLIAVPPKKSGLLNKSKEILMEQIKQANRYVERIQKLKENTF